MHTSLLGSLGIVINKNVDEEIRYANVKGKPIVVSTWAPNVKANAEAWTVLGNGGRALDAVEAGGLRSPRQIPLIKAWVMEDCQTAMAALHWTPVLWTRRVIAAA